MKSKTKRHLSRAHHIVTKKKILKKRHAQRVFQSFFIVVATICTGSLAFAITTTRPVVNVDLQADFKPHSIVTEPAYTGPDQVGTASWYALGLPAPDALTCASTKFARGTYLQVKNLLNNLTVTCLVNDYGPEAWTHRAIDLSRGSFRVIENLGAGTIPVEIRVVQPAPQPTGFNFTLRSFIGRFTGYRLCQILHSAGFCESNRQKTWAVK